MRIARIHARRGKAGHVIRFNKKILAQRTIGVAAFHQNRLRPKRPQRLTLRLRVASHCTIQQPRGFGQVRRQQRSTRQQASRQRINCRVVQQGITGFRHHHRIKNDRAAILRQRISDSFDDLGSTQHADLDGIRRNV